MSKRRAVSSLVFLVGALVWGGGCGEERHKCVSLPAQDMGSGSPDMASQQQVLKSCSDKDKAAFAFRETALEGGKPVSVSSLQELLGGQEALIGDRAAEEAFTRLSGGRASGYEASVYALSDVSAYERGRPERLTRWGMSGAVSRPDGDMTKLTEGDRHVEFNALSGYERYVDKALFHKGDGSAPLASKADYVAKAWAYVGATRRVDPTVELYPYKYRKYMNGESAQPGVVTTSAYQHAVAFNQTIDDLPVIGSGSKVVVHMTGSGQVVSYTDNTRGVGEHIKTVKLKDTADALSDARAQLAARGGQPDRYIVSRSEFGYLRRGRGSAQRYLIPHYAFVFAPANAAFGSKKTVEVVPATDDPDTVRLAREDEDDEALRKQLRYGVPSAPDTK